MQISYATVEMSDGTVFARERITLQDRLRLERTARANKWDIANANYTPSTNSFLGWSALERSGKITVSYEEFTNGAAVDVYIEQGEAELGPTEPVPFTG